VLAGMFLLAAYYFYWDGTFPVSSLFNKPFPRELAVFGLFPWALLIHVVWRFGRQTPRPGIT
jgi:hypothetical protein